MSDSTPMDAPIATGLDRRRATELRYRYRQYRLREAQAFLHLIPREGVRPLYGAAREWAVERACHDSREPMAALLAYVLETLPLPPFDVWLKDYVGHRFEHAVISSRHPSSGSTTRHTTVDSRTVRHRARRWSARLELARDGSRWRGCIAFEDAGGEARRALNTDASNGGSAKASAGLGMSATASSRDAFRTTDIFVEHDPRVIRNRFREYHEDTLRGFLRSVLP